MMQIALFSLPTSHLRIWAGCLLVLCAVSQCQSQLRPPQVIITPEDTVGYPFLQQNENAIENAAYLEPLFQKMYLQRTEGGRKISILHIGDSHILGNYLTKEVRARLQRAFGDAGRGLIFPYRLAGSNGPKDFLVETNCRWQSDNCQKDLAEQTPFGLSGFFIETSSPNGRLSVRLRDTATAETRMFTKVTVFHRNHAAAFDFIVRDETTNQEAFPVFEDDFSQTFYFDRPVSQFTLQNRKKSGQKSLTIDGISIENELSGVVYHSIGVNGAKFFDFARAKYFARQAGELYPDLIILSFGTNEGQASITPRSFQRQMEALTDALLEASPASLIMLTTPADSYLRGKGFNPYLAEARSAIRAFARSKGFAVWDLYTLGGGENSAQTWKSSGLMASDSVHYSKAGYAAQGKMLYQSLINEYNLIARRLARRDSITQDGGQ